MILKKGFLMKSSENFVQFLVMEQKHKKDWIEYKKTKIDAKIALKKKFIDEWVTMGKKYMELLGKGGVDVEKYLADKLRDAVKLHEKQKNEMKELCDTDRKKADNLFAAQKTELDNFKKAVGIS